MEIRLRNKEGAGCEEQSPSRRALGEDTPRRLVSLAGSCHEKAAGCFSFQLTERDPRGTASGYDWDIGSSPEDCSLTPRPRNPSALSFDNSVVRS